MRIEPTVGRVVLFIAVPGDVLFRESFAGEPLAAQVAHVNDDGTINVGVLDRDGYQHARQRVHLVQPDDETRPTTESYCEWMPFQKGQAAKTEDFATHAELADLDNLIGEARSIAEDAKKAAEEALAMASKKDAPAPASNTAAPV